MILIVEGIDRIGKTTLVNYINKISGKDNFVYQDLGKNIIQPRVFDNKNETDKLMKLLSMIDLIGKDKFIIFDRFHWSDFSYGLIRRKYDFELAIRNFNIIENKLLELDAKVICLFPGNEKTLSECEQEDDSNDLGRINDMFILCKKMSKLKTLDIVVFNKSLSFINIEKNIKEFIYE